MFRVVCKRSRWRPLAFIQRGLAQQVVSPPFNTDIVENFQKMRTAGTEPDLDTYNRVLQAYHHTKEPEKRDEVFRHLRQTGRADISCYNTMLSLVYEDPEKVEDLYQQLQNDETVVPNIETCNRFAKAYMQDEKKFLALFQYISSAGLLPNTRTYQLLFLKFRGNPDKVVEVYKLMKDQGVTPSIDNFSLLATIFYGAKRVDLILELAAVIRKQKIAIDAGAFLKIFYCLHRSQRPDEALWWSESQDYAELARIKPSPQFLRTPKLTLRQPKPVKETEMQEPPPSPDELEYRKQAMLDLLEQSSKKKAKEPPPLPSPPPEPSSLEKFKQLRSRYLKRTPLQLHYDRFLSSKFVTNLRKEQLRNKTYTSLLSYYTAKDLKKAYQEYKKIQGQALTPDLRLYSVVIDLLGRYRKYSEQARVYEQMLARGLEPDELIYIRMILSCIEQMEFPRAEKIILEAKKKGVHSLRFYGRILKQYAHLEHWNLAQKFWETELLPSGIAPDLQMYTLAGKMYYRLRNIDKSLAIFEEAASKFGLDDKAISVYLLAYCRLHTVPEVEQKFMELTAKSPPTLYTYTSLLKVYISDDRLGEALKILQKMQNQEGTRPSVVTYTVILAKLGREKRMVSVWYIFQLLKDEGVFPDARLWEVMLKAHLDKNGHNVVDAFVRELRKKNIFPAFSVKFILRLYYFYRDEQDMEMANWLLSAGVDGSRKRLEEAS